MAYSALALGHDGLRLRSRRVRSDRSYRLSVRFAVVMFVVAGLGGLGGAAFEVRSSTAVEVPPGDGRGYVEALSPIHASVEQSVERLGLLAALYENHEIDRDELRTRLDDSLASYRRAEEEMQALQPPPELRTVHQDYLEALALLRLSALEMRQASEDGDETHFSAAVPLSMQGMTRIRSLMDGFWPTRVG